MMQNMCAETTLNASMSSIDYEGGLPLHLPSPNNLPHQTLENANQKASGDE
jgi:hypothetical protein